MELVKFSPEPNKSVAFIQAVACAWHTGVFNPDGTRMNSKHNMFVDDNLMAEIRKWMPQAMAASIEALFRLLGRPAPQFRKSALCLEKIIKALCSYKKTQLGKVINTRTMTVSMTEERIIHMTAELDHWHSRRKSFTIRQGAQLLGLLEHAATYVVWAKFLFYGLRHSMLIAIRLNTKKIHNDLQFKDIVLDAHNTALTPHTLLKKQFASSKLARTIWDSKEKHFINSTLKAELKFLREILLDPIKYHWSSPIAHLVRRTPEIYSAGDACLTGAGGFSRNAKFWWFLQWPKEIIEKTLKEFNIRVRIDKEHFISINLLEYATILISYAAASQAFQDGLIVTNQPFPIIHIDSDNMSSIAWTKKAATATIKSKALTRIFAALTLNNPLGLTTGHIQGKLNELPDLISRINSNKNAQSFTQILQKYPWLNSCHPYQPSQELVSHLLSALLQGQAPAMVRLTNLGHFVPVPDTGWNGAL